MGLRKWMSTSSNGMGDSRSNSGSNVLDGPQGVGSGSPVPVQSVTPSGTPVLDGSGSGQASRNGSFKGKKRGVFKEYLKASLSRSSSTSRHRDQETLGHGSNLQQQQQQQSSSSGVKNGFLASLKKESAWATASTSSLGSHQSSFITSSHESIDGEHTPHISETPTSESHSENSASKDNANSAELLVDKVRSLDDTIIDGRLLEQSSESRLFSTKNSTPQDSTTQDSTTQDSRDNVVVTEGDTESVDDNENIHKDDIPQSKSSLIVSGLNSYVKNTFSRKPDSHKKSSLKYEIANSDEYDDTSVLRDADDSRAPTMNSLILEDMNNESVLDANSTEIDTSLNPHSNYSTRPSTVEDTDHLHFPKPVSAGGLPKPKYGSAPVLTSEKDISAGPIPQSSASTASMLKPIISPSSLFNKLSLDEVQTHLHLKHSHATPKLHEVIKENNKVFGLENFGNTCYFNSMIQCLFGIDEFRIKMMTPLIPEEDHERKNYCYPLKPRYFTKQSLTISSNKHQQQQKSGTKIFSTDDALAKLNTSYDRVIVGRTRSDKKHHTSETRKKNALLKGPVLNIDHLSPNYNAITREWEKDDSKIMYYCLKDFFEYIIENKYNTGVASPIKFLSSLRAVNCMYDCNMHQDAQEFLNFLLNSVSEYLNDFQKENFVNDLFQGNFVNKTKCLNCKSLTFRDEPFLELSVNISKDVKDIQSYFDNYYQKESLSGANKFHCDNCQSLQDAERIAEIEKLPKVLILQLKRYKYSEREKTNIKLFNKVEYPLYLQVSCSSSPSPEPGSTLVSTFSNTSQRAKHTKYYTLTSIVIHLGGGPSHGHYISIVKNPTLGWLLYDDETVENIDEKDVLKFIGDVEDLSAAYVLFYKEVDFEVYENAVSNSSTNNNKSFKKLGGKNSKKEKINYRDNVIQFIKEDELFRNKIEETRKNSIASVGSDETTSTAHSIISQGSSIASNTKQRRRSSVFFGGFKKNNNSSSPVTSVKIKEEDKKTATVPA